MLPAPDQPATPEKPADDDFDFCPPPPVVVRTGVLVPKEKYDAMQAELLALRRELEEARGRAEDLGMLLRVAMDGDIYPLSADGFALDEPSRFYLEAGADGLPVLTDEARAALRRSP